MRKTARALVLGFLAILTSVVLGVASALMAAFALGAATALIVPGTGTPDANEVEDYMENFRDYYMQGTPCEDDGCPDGDLQGIDYFASFWPIPLPGWCDPGRCEKFDDSVDDGVTNLGDALEALQALGYDGDIVIAGYSQGARVVSIGKMQFANGDWDEFLDQVESVSFVFIGNPNRPNGGLLSRLGILGTIPILEVTTGQPTPTDTEFATEDWAIRWEGIADFPLYLFNPLAVVNSILGFTYDHGTYLAINEDSDPGELPAGYDVATWREITKNPHLYPDIVDIQTYGDTTYYTVTPKVLPLVRPLHAIPFIGKPIADLIEPALRVIIEETGYNRNIPFGQPAGIQLFPIFNPITLVLKLIPAIFQGINNFLANFGLATEIPLSPTVPVPAVSPLGDQQEDETLLNEPDDSSGARLALVQDNGDVEQQQVESSEKLLVTNTEIDADLMLAEGNETPITEGTTEPEETVLEETVLEETVLEGNEIVGVLNKDPEEIKDPEENKDPEEHKDPAGNRIEANGGSVSLNFSTNKPTESPTSGGEGLDQLDPADDEEPTADAEGTEGSQDSEQAAA